MEVRLFKEGSLSIDSSSVVAMSPSLGSVINVVSVSSLSGVHVSFVHSEAELSRLHLGLKLSSVSSGVGVVDSVGFMSSVGVSLEVRLVISESEVRLSQFLGHQLSFVRNFIAVGGGDSTYSLSLSIDVR
jgi:hypothetical protein